MPHDDKTDKVAFFCRKNQEALMATFSQRVDHACLAHCVMEIEFHC